MAPVQSKILTLTGLPAEILLEIYQQLDVDSIYQFCLVNRSLYALFARRKVSIILPVLVRDFDPFDELLQVYTASGEDLENSNGTYRPRRVIFKRDPDDSGIVLSPRPELWPLQTNGAHDAFTRVSKARKPNAPATAALKTKILTERDLKPILRSCRLVRKWEELFPQMRWYHEPENCRILRPHEAARFRTAFYRWWLYAFYFHGDFDRPSVGLPEPFVNDIRTSLLRYYSTTELLELMDWVETMKDVVLHYICPRLDPNEVEDYDEVPLVETIDRPQALLSGWTDQSPWGRILRTYAKLDPKQLMFFFENIYSLHRIRLITAARLHYSSFTDDQESIQLGIRCALDERQWTDNMPSLAEDSKGGIIDFDDDRDLERIRFADDASPDGSLPPGVKFCRSYSRYSPRGDDGSHLEDARHSAWAGMQFTSALGRSLPPPLSQ